MSKQTTKRCHWVPQAYLKAFAADQDQKKIWRFSKNSGDPELKPIDKVAVKFHLYSPLDENGRRDDFLEKKLSSLESWFGDPIWKAVCNDFPDFKWEPLRKMVALLVAVSWLRTPTQFEFWKSTHNRIVQSLLQHDRLPDAFTINGKTYELDHTSWPAFQSASEEEMKLAWNNWIGSSADIALMLMKMRWAILISDTPEFITSDNPVLVGDTLGPHRGLTHPDTLVTFPLSPTRILMMDNRHSEPDSQFYRVNSVAATNSLIWRNAIEYMFSPRPPDKVCAEIVADAERMGMT